jgi:hypothetical protein
VKQYRIVFENKYELEFIGEYYEESSKWTVECYTTKDGKVIYCNRSKMLFVEQREIES